MSNSGDNYRSNAIDLYKNNRNTTLTITEEDNGVAIEPTQHFLRRPLCTTDNTDNCIGNGSSGDGCPNFREPCLHTHARGYIVTVYTRAVLDSSRKRSTDEAETSSADGRDPVGHVDQKATGSSGTGTEIAATSASGVAMATNGGDSWTVSRPDRNLLVVVHPWCMLRKSGADRQSEFPPPGFLERLKAKLLAIHRETDRGQHRQSPADAFRRRYGDDDGQTIKCWFRYTAAATDAFRGRRANTIAATNASDTDGPAVFDFLTIRRRFAVPRETNRPANARS
ncbi:uncharacterized protein LOC112681880 [Sipha flava]|uniref:Uncharacterized protein LOC112681880 n=2 Tax=Sipha flava TaxID=143950 RepID=A0A8B8FCE5_9HEMI|nr:uncharacterized protein LOC112681880 [Sipha flava]